MFQEFMLVRVRAILGLCFQLKDYEIMSSMIFFSVKTVVWITS